MINLHSGIFLVACLNFRADGPKDDGLRMRIQVTQKEINVIILIFLSFFVFYVKAEKSIEECYLKNLKEFTIKNTVPKVNRLLIK